MLFSTSESGFTLTSESGSTSTHFIRQLNNLDSTTDDNFLAVHLINEDTPPLPIDSPTAATSAKPRGRGREGRAPTTFII